MDPIEKALRLTREKLAEQERRSERTRREMAAKELQRAQAVRRKDDEEKQSLQKKREREKYEVDLRVWRLNNAVRISGIHTIFDKFSREFLGFTKHRILQELDPNGYSGSVKLMWGKYRMKGGEVSRSRAANYSVVTANFNVYDELDREKSKETRDFVTLGNEVIPIVPQGGWDHQVNGGVLRTDLSERLAIAVHKNFINPEHVEWRPERQHYSSSSHGDSTPECCCT